ncbi:MAG: short-chain dehydrogenase [Bacteroidia bacterium]|nr:MAG: short-chain dehydrogenase [Bacteroidia bacterium]
MFSKDTLKGKKILITGGGSGLGLSMAKAFAAHGADVAICGRDEEKLKNALQEILQVKTSETKAVYHSCDVRNYEQVQSTIQYCVQELGGLNGLVNNAAGNFLAMSEDLTPNGFKAVTEIVLQGSFNCSHAFGKYIIENKVPQSDILNIVTTYTHSGCAFVLPSACAKAGVYAMTMTLAFEWANYGIRCNAIAPGPFPTKGAWDRLMPSKDIEQFYIQRIPMKRYGEHEELTNLAVFMMSDLARYLNGECVTIDGGEHLQNGQFNFFAQMFSQDQIKQIFRSVREKNKK